MDMRGVSTTIGFAVRRARTTRAALAGDPAARLLAVRQARNPFPLYERIRDHGEVYRSGLGFFCTVSHPLCRSVLTDPRFHMPSHQGLPDWARSEDDVRTLVHPIERSLLAMNPPEQTRLRRLIAPWFSASALRRRQPRIEKIIHGYLDDLSGRTDFDLVTDFATEVPTAVIGDILGVPITDYRQFGRWGTAVATTIDGVRTTGERRRVRATLVEMTAYFRELVARNRTDPGDNMIADILGATVGEAPLEQDDVIALAGLLLAAGLETTVNLISDSVRLMLAHPEQKRSLLGDPDLAADVVEETLRYDPPATFTARMAVEDVELAGVTLPKGAVLFQLLPGANRDPRVFAEPDRFDIGRPNNREHISFSGGVHHCIGSGLARMEATIAVREMFQRFPHLRTAGATRMRTARSARGPISLPVRVR
jgi:cytochrome P450